MEAKQTLRLGFTLCFGALVMALLISDSTADGTTSLKLLESYKRFDIGGRLDVVRKEGRQVAFRAQTTSHSNRAMLQSPPRFCDIQGGQCVALTSENAPDGSVRSFGTQSVLCALQSNETLCGDREGCIWSEGECTMDVLWAIRDCLEPNYLTVVRGTDCEGLSTAPKCDFIPGCKWDERFEACSVEPHEVVEALNSNQELGEAFLQNLECAELTTCEGACELISGTCGSPKLARIPPWITSSAPFCQYMKRLFECVHHDSVSCPEMCEFDEEEGVCIFPEHSEEFIDIMYVQDPNLGEQMKLALQQCPGITDPVGCRGFVP